MRQTGYREYSKCVGCSTQTPRGEVSKLKEQNWHDRCDDDVWAFLREIEVWLKGSERKGVSS